jgi:protein required for attachment to host cells
MNIWIVVADEREALFYDASSGSPADRELDDGRRWSDAYSLVFKVTNPQARPDRELETDRPGRKFSVSTGQRHAVGGERSTRRTDQENFARRIADEIERARNSRKFDKLVLAAGPRMLGLIRGGLSDSARACLAAEIAKDLVKFEGFELLEHLPRRALPRAGLRY